MEEQSVIEAGKRQFRKIGLVQRGILVEFDLDDTVIGNNVENWLFGQV